MDRSHFKFDDVFQRVQKIRGLACPGEWPWLIDVWEPEVLSPTQMQSDVANLKKKTLYKFLKKVKTLK
jgi:hypothetical protein